MPKSPIKRVLDRVITISSEEMETTHIIQGRPLSDVIEILGIAKPRVINISEKDNELGIYIPSRPMHEIAPLANIAQTLNFEVWVTFYDINGSPIYYITEPPIDDVGTKFYIYLRQRIGEIGISSPSEVISLARDSLDDLGVDPRLAFNVESIKGAIYYAYRDILGYSALEIPMEDPNIEEVSWFSYDGPVQVVDKKIASMYPNAEFVVTNLFFEIGMPDIQKKFFMTQSVRAITSRARVGLTTAKPIAEARIPDPSGRGFHRLAAHLDVVSRSPAITIRKFPQKKMSITELIKLGSISSIEASYLMWQLINRGFILIVGAMASGKSLSENEHLIVNIDGKVALTTFKELWNKIISKHKTYKIENMEIIPNPDITILSLSKNGVEWKKPRYLIRHKYTGEMYTVQTKTGRKITVTPDHSLMVWKTNERNDILITPIRPTDIEEKEYYVPYLREIPLPSTLSKSDIISNPKFGYLLGLISIKGKINTETVELYQLNTDTLNHMLNIMTEFQYSVEAPNRIEANSKAIIVHDLPLTTILPNSKQIPTIFWNMNEEWRATFIAGILDGGSYVNTNRYIIELITPNYEFAYSLLYALSSIGIHGYIRQKHNKKYQNQTYYQIYIPIVINKESLEKVIPFLSIKKRNEIKEVIEKTNLTHTTIDVIPSKFIQSICKKLKKKRLKEKIDVSWKICSSKYIHKDLPFSMVKNMMKNNIHNFIPKYIGFDNIEKIEKTQYNGYVYDIEVPKNENFESNGIIIHNTTLLQALISALPMTYKIMCVAPNTRIAGKRPYIIDNLFKGKTSKKENMESVKRKVKVIGFNNGKVVWATSDEVHKIFVPKSIKLRKIITEYGAEVTVTPNTKIPTQTKDKNIVYKDAIDIKEGDLILQLARYNPPIKELNNVLIGDLRDYIDRKDRIEKHLFNAPVEYIKSLISGVIDSRGSVTDKYAEIRVKTRELADDLVILLLRLGVVGKINKCNEDWCIRFEGKQYKILVNELYGWSIKINMNAKKSNKTIKNNKYIWAKVEKTEDVEHNGVVYDISPKEAKYFFAGNGGFIVVEDTIEDTPELSTPAQNWHPVYVRRAPKESELEDVSYDKLVLHTLRHRGTVVTLGEVRGAEMADLIQAAASVSKDTQILAKIDNEIILTTIGNIIDEEYGNTFDWTKVKPKRKIEVLTLTKDGKVEFKPVNWVLRHWSREIYNIKYIGGSIKTTGSHSIFVLDENTLEIKAKRVDKIKKGDILITFIKKPDTKISNVNNLKLQINQSPIKELSNSDTKANLISQVSWILRLIGKPSYIETKENVQHIKIKEVRKNDVNNKSGRIIPLKPLQELAFVLKPKVNSIDKEISKYLYDNKGYRFVTFKTAKRILDYIVKNKTNTITNTTRELIERIKWIINSEIELTIITDIKKEKYDDFVYDFSVSESEAFFGGSIPVLLHNSGHGAICLPPDTVVIARDKNTKKTKMINIKDLVLSYNMGNDWEVYSFNPEKNKFEWKPVTASIQIQTDLWIEIKTKSGRKLKMTPNHRMLIFNPITEKTEIIEAKDIRIGDMIMILSTIPRDGVKYNFICCDVILSFSADIGRILGEALKFGINSDKYILPLRYINSLKELPIKVPFTTTKSSIKIQNRRFNLLISSLIDTIKSIPFKLPYYFLNGLGEVLSNSTIKSDDRKFLYSLHYALKTVGYDSVVDDDNLTIKINEKKNKEYFFEKVEEVKTEQKVYEDAYDIEVGGNHTFITKDSIVSGNCTFHAHDPESVLARITSPPINASPESLKMITSIVHIAKTKTYARGESESVRRVIRIFEIKDVKEKEIQATEVFKWNPLTDVHTPQLSDEGLIELWKRSTTIRTIGKNIFVDEAPRALLEIFSMAKYLDLLVNAGVININEVIFKMTTLYQRIDKIVNELWKTKYKNFFKERGIL